MDYSKICGVYAGLEGMTSGLEKTGILAGFLKVDFWKDTRSEKFS